MMHLLTIARRRDASRARTRARIVAVLGLLFAPGAAGHAQRIDLPRDRPSPASTMDAWRSVEAWVRAWETPSTPQAIDPDGCSGACVTLRLGGDVIGRGRSMRDDATAIWHATRAAIARADTRLPLEEDALRDRRVRDLATMVAIDLQVAGPLRPLLGETFGACARSLSPGIDGVAVRRGDDLLAEFPGTLLATRRHPVSGLEGLRTELGLPLVELAELRDIHSMRPYAFRAQHLAQPRPGDAPVFLYRGGRIVPLADVSVRSLRALASDMAANLEARRWPGEEPFGLREVYHPTIDRFDPLVAGPRAQAIGAYALALFAGVSGAPEDEAHRALLAAREVLDELRQVEDDEADPLAEPTAAAAWLSAHVLVERALAPEHQSLDDPFAAIALGRILEDRDEGSAGERAMLAMALALASTCPGADPALARNAGDLCTAIIAQTPVTQLVTTMPWLMTALDELAGDAPIGAAPALEEMRELVWRHMIRPSDAGPDSLDQVGGIVFTRSREARPTYRSLFPLAALAQMLGRPDLTPVEQRSPELANMLGALRYLVQLTPGDAEMHMYRRPARAKGGVRHAVWDQAMSIDSTAMGLITLSRVLQSVD